MEKEPRKKSLSLEATEEEKVMQIEKKRKILEVETSVSLQTTATGCSECNMGFHKDLTREQHQKSRSHVRNLLYSNYERHKAEMLKKLEPGCQCGRLKEGEGEAEGEDHRGWPGGD